MKQTLYGLDDSVTVVEAISYNKAFKLICEEAKLDKALVDLAAPELNGFGSLKALRNRVGDAPVVIAFAMEDCNELRRAMDCGESGYVPKALYSKDMLGALNLVFKGGVYRPTCLLGGIDGDCDSKWRGRNKGKSPLRAR